MRLTDEQRQMVEDNHGLIKKYLSNHSATMAYEDWYDVLAIGLCKAVAKYNPEIGAFSTFAFKCMNMEVSNEIANQQRENRRIHRELLYFSDNKSLFADQDDEDYEYYLESHVPRYCSVENEAVANCMLSEYTAKNKMADKIFQLYRQGYTQEEIAKECGCTKANISLIKKDLEAYVKTGNVKKKKKKFRSNERVIASIFAEIQDTWRELKCAAV